jgi:hypothetical protein
MLPKELPHRLLVVLLDRKRPMGTHSLKGGEPILLVGSSVVVGAISAGAGLLPKFPSVPHIREPFLQGVTCLLRHFLSYLCSSLSDYVYAMAVFCPACQNVVDKIFVRSLYQYDAHDTSMGGGSKDHTLVQVFPHSARNQDLVSSSQTCSLCCLIKDELYASYCRSSRPHSAQDFESSWLGRCPMDIRAKGGNHFRTPPRLGDALQLCSLYINTIYGSCMGANISIYAENGPFQYSMNVSSFYSNSLSLSILSRKPCGHIW